jgi:hypothetical protein
MSPALVFHRLFHRILARQVEYSYGDEEQAFTSMAPLGNDLLPKVIELARALPYAGEWGWAIERFSSFVRPDAYLLRLDWDQGEPAAVTLYCRFPEEPDDTQFQAAVKSARPFHWNGPLPSRIAGALGLPGPRGIAFRANRQEVPLTAIYFRSQEHAGPSWMARLAALLAACQYSEELAATIEADLKALYTPGPAGVIGVDDGEGVPGALKFDPSNVSLASTFAFLRKAGVPAQRIAGLAATALGLRADAATYVGVKYSQLGFAGWRVYFSCEPPYGPTPSQPTIAVERNLRPVRRLPHY